MKYITDDEATEIWFSAPSRLIFANALIDLHEKRRKAAKAEKRKADKPRPMLPPDVEAARQRLWECCEHASWPREELSFVDLETLLTWLDPQEDAINEVAAAIEAGAGQVDKETLVQQEVWRAQVGEMPPEDCGCVWMSWDGFSPSGKQCTQLHCPRE